MPAVRREKELLRRRTQRAIGGRERREGLEAADPWRAARWQRTRRRWRTRRRAHSRQDISAVIASGHVVHERLGECLGSERLGGHMVLLHGGHEVHDGGPLPDVLELGSECPERRPCLAEAATASRVAAPMTWRLGCPRRSKACFMESLSVTVFAYLEHVEQWWAKAGLLLQLYFSSLKSAQSAGSTSSVSCSHMTLWRPLASKASSVTPAADSRTTRADSFFGPPRR